MNRYTAKLLFQFRVTVAENVLKRRTCEERYITFQATCAKLALAHAKRKGREGQYSYKGMTGAHVKVEFVGVMELLLLRSSSAEDEVYYDIKRMVSPSERKDDLLLPEHALHAFRIEAELKPASNSVRRRNPQM